MISLIAQQTVAVVLVLAVVLGPGMVGVGFLLRRKRQARAERRSPLTSDLLRTPGHALRQQLEDARVDLAFDLTLLMMVPALGMAGLYATSLVTGKTASLPILLALLLAVLAFSAHHIRALLRRTAQMDRWRLGLDAELAVSQELDHLMREGAVVFHDVPGEKFNLDHVVIAPQGVFAVETKGYAKPNRGGGNADATLTFDGKSLALPHWSTSKPLDQAERQAKWLCTWLGSATGEPVHVVPVLALPGWYVDRKGRGAVLVFSGKELRGHLLKARTAQPLGAEQMQRVIYQVEQRCRNVEPEYRADEE